MICSNCFQDKDENMFSKKKSGEFLKECRQCRVDIVIQNKNEKLLDMFPNQYYQCSNENCNYVWRRSFGQKCRKCNSFYDEGLI